MGNQQNDSFNNDFDNEILNSTSDPQKDIQGSEKMDSDSFGQGGYYDNSSKDITYSPFGDTPQAVVTPSSTAKKRHSTLVVILSSVLAAIIGFAGCFAAMFFLKDQDENTTLIEKIITSDDKNENTNVNINVDEDASSIAQAVAKKATQSVVGIRVTLSGQFGSSSGGEGSGVVYSSDGYIITNYHVIEYGVQYQNSRIEVFFNNDLTNSYTASIVGYNIASDLAVIKIDAKNLKPVEVGDSDKLEVGQYAVTIGCPSGLEFMGSVTYGIISGLNRQVSSDSEIGLIQTDAAINPGNSGGALLDSTGKLIGINSSKIVAEEFEGMGFAIPVNTVVDVCDDIIKNKDKAEPYLGISINERYTPEVLERYGYPVGAVVYSVAGDSPAEKAGIRRNDIITKFNGEGVEKYSDLVALVKKCEPGDSISVTVYRAGRTLTLTVIIGSNTAG